VLCVTGAECTGKSTLSAALAAHFDVPLVAEVARAYLNGRADYGPDDVLEIAARQQAAEAEALRRSNLVVADTDLTVIQIWWEEKFGALPEILTQALDRRSPRGYLLACPDLSWEFDPLRESPNDRPRLHDRYRTVLAAGPFPFREVAGRDGARVAAALAAFAAMTIGLRPGAAPRP
jgi:nicotinamide riboside kinase